MKELYLYHHLGLGDHILCNAIVRNYAKLFDKIYLFVKPHNYENVKYMYRDLKNIEYLIGDDYFAKQFIINKKNVLKVGFEKLDVRFYNFDESFYRCIGMNFEKRWSDFYIERDLEKEKNILKELNISEDFIFIHDGGSSGKNKIDLDAIRKDLPIIKSEKKYPFFDYCYIIENAKEIHCINSSFMVLVESLKTNGNLFFHNINPTYNQTLKKDWKIIST